MLNTKESLTVNRIYYAPECPSEKPLLHFNLYADQISRLISQQSGGAAFVFAIHGPWGSGKTTLMKAILSRLTQESEKNIGLKPLVVEFNAWKYQEREVLWRALLLRVISEIESVTGEKDTEQIRESLYRAFEVEERGPTTIDYKKLVVEIVGAALKLWNLGFLTKVVKSLQPRRWFQKKTDEEKGFGKEDVEGFLGVFTREIVRTKIHKVESIEQFLNEFEKLVQLLEKKNRNLVVFVDDLDRCLPESTLDIFEAIKLFMDVNGVTFNLCLDRDIIRKALKVRYDRLKGSEDFVDPDEYIEKAITLAFHIPPMDKNAMDKYLNSLPMSNRWTSKCLDIVKIGLKPNPRRLKRFINGVELLFDLVDSSALVKPSDLEREYLVKIYCIAYRWSHFFDEIVERLDAFTDYISLIDQSDFDVASAQFAKKWANIDYIAQNRDLYNFIKEPPSLSGMNSDELRKYFSYLNLASEPDSH